MRSEREKMLAGEPYLPYDPELIEARLRARKITRQLNDTCEDEPEKRQELVRSLFGETGKQVWIISPFHCDYGVNISLGNRVLFNSNCVVLDCAEVKIGNNVFIGPAVQIYTAIHPIDAVRRASGESSAKSIIIDSDVWIGGATVICPGVRIGARSVIGAGSVVTRDIPADVVAVGNPCRVIRQLTEADRTQDPSILLSDESTA